MSWNSAYFQSSAYSSHYAQAYLGTQALPSTSSSTSSAPNRQIGPHGPWYSPGSARCTYPKCTFVGSAKSLEIHRMDRHLIYPPGYKPPKESWDADPSLKGKKIPIMGTTLSLDTPEALEAWIAERKKRWPSASRVLEKRKKLEDAVERGQLDADVLASGNKRRRLNTKPNLRESGKARVKGTSSRALVDTTTRNRALASERTEGNSDDDDGPPEIASSRPPVPLTPRRDGDSAKQIGQVQAQRKLRTSKTPRPPMANPFAPRSNLMRNLLLSEIRITVSNLSQAIRFIVDNDFLDDVELHPGDSARRMIEVISVDSAEKS